MTALTLSCSHTGVGVEVYVLPPKVQGTMNDYQSDVYFLQHELPKRHEHVYHTLSEGDYEKSVNELFLQCADLDPLVAAMRIQGFVAAIGDAHTSYTTPMTTAAALNIVWLEGTDESSDHVFVTASLEESLVRAAGQPARVELLEINGIPIFSSSQTGARDSLFERFITYIPHEEGNLFKVKETISTRLLDPKVLYGMGVIDSPEGPIPMTFSDSSSLTTDRDCIEVIETATFQEHDWHLYYTDAEYQDRDRSVLPFFIREAYRKYTFEYDEEAGLLHILYNSCSEDPDLAFGEFVKQAFAAVTSTDRLRAVVVDLRNNSGGNSRLINPLLGVLDDLPDSVQLYAAISPKTFSSALMNAVQLERRYSGLTLIGRPTGGKPNHYGEVRTVRLPSGNHISYSISYFTTMKGNSDPYLMPEVSIPLTADDYFALTPPQAVGVDPVISYVLGQIN